MRPVLLRLLVLRRTSRRRRIVVFGFRLCALLRLRSSLLFPHSRLRLRPIVPSVGLSKRTEAFLRLWLPRRLRRRHSLPWRLLSHQCLLAQVCSCLRLLLIE